MHYTYDFIPLVGELKIFHGTRRVASLNITRVARDEALISNMSGEYNKEIRELIQAYLLSNGIVIARYERLKNGKLITFTLGDK